jgi:hypothetical protein
MERKRTGQMKRNGRNHQQVRRKVSTDWNWAPLPLLLLLFTSPIKTKRKREGRIERTRKGPFVRKGSMRRQKDDIVGAPENMLKRRPRA